MQNLMAGSLGRGRKSREGEKGGGRKQRGGDVGDVEEGQRRGQERKREES